jgi:hypothetical protein
MEILGFTENTLHTSSSNTLVSNNSINLFTIRNIYIQSYNVILNNINNSTPNNSSILCSIPVTTGQNSMIIYNNANNIKSNIDSVRNFTQLHIALTDQDGAILDLNGVHFSLTLQIDIVF